MANKKTARRALFSSVLALILCCCMLVGTTFAWFTDSVTSANNIIKSGTLDVTMEWYDGTKAVPAVDSADWKDASKGAIFNYDLWEPGYTEVRHIKIANEGTLALKYQVQIRANGEVSDLADVIDVYYVDPAVEAGVANRTELNDSNKIGTLTEVLAGIGGTARGSLEANESVTVTIALKMKESAGNEYQNKAIGSDFSIVLLATQYTSEDDSFDEFYDKNAWVDGLDVYTEEDLNTALANGETVIDVLDNIDLTAPIVIPAAATTYSLRNSGIIINLKGHKLSGTGLDANGEKSAVVQNNGTLTLVGGTVSSTGTNGGSAILNKGILTLENVTVKGAPSDTVAGTASYAVNTEGAGSKLTVKNSNISGRGAIGATNGTKVEINGGTYHTPAVAWGHAVYANGEGTEVVINGGTFTEGWDYAADLWGMYQIYSGNKAKVTVNGGDFSQAWDCANGYDLCTAGEGIIEIKGGTFADNPSKQNNNNYVAEGYKAAETANGYMVIPANADYVADGVLKSTDEKTYFLSNKAGYDWMEQQTDSFFAGKTVKLDASIDFGGETIKDIHFWNPEDKTAFDGQGNTLSNFVIANDGVAGLFSGTCTVKNLVVDNANVTGQYAGVIAGNMYGDIENVTVKNSVVNGTYWQTGALVGQYNAGSITNCVVEDCSINGLAAVGALVGIVNETAGERNFVNCTVKNCAINQTGSFGGNYDEMFGVAVGLVNIDNSTVRFTNCTIEGNTVKGVASDVLCGVVGSGTSVTDIAATEEGFVLAKDCVNGGLYLYDTAEYTGTELEVPAGVTAIGNYAFAYNNTIETVVLPATVTDLGRGFDSSAVKKVVLNEGLETISPRAFKSTDALVEVVIPTSVKTIADNAFQKSGLKEIVIPANVETIGEAAFGSSKIEKVTFEGNTSIQGFAFRGCPNLREVHLKGDNVTFIASTLNGRNSCWFCNGESNNPNTSNITFHVVNETVAARVKTAMGAEAANTRVYVNGVLYEG